MYLKKKKLIGMLIEKEPPLIISTSKGLIYQVEEGCEEWVKRRKVGR